MEITLKALAEFVDGRVLRGDPGTRYQGIGSLKEAGPGDISFFGNGLYAEDLSKTSAGAVLVPREDVKAPEDVALVCVDNPVTAFDLLVRRLSPPRPKFQPGIHPSAVVGAGVKLDETKVCVGPCVVVEDGCRIGNGTWLGAGTVIGEGTEIGEHCLIHPNVSILYGSIVGDHVIVHSGAVIGADGFGFQFVDGRHQKIEQLGRVRIGDYVEIGANTTVDRARFGETVIGEGTKIDNLVQIAHNAVIGNHCIVVAQSGISGSAHLEDHVVVGAQVGIAGHLRVGEKSVIGGKSGVIASLKGGETYFGYPARPMKESLRQSMYMKRLGSLFGRVKALEQKLSGKTPKGGEAEAEEEEGQA